METKTQISVWYFAFALLGVITPRDVWQGVAVEPVAGG